jgi:hypothetical protein
MYYKQAGAGVSSPIESEIIFYSKKVILQK